ncbi:MAG: hypothetical protein WA463_08025 [Terriglobales bacterium]
MALSRHFVPGYIRSRLAALVEAQLHRVSVRPAGRASEARLVSPFGLRRDDIAPRRPGAAVAT